MPLPMSSGTTVRSSKTKKTSKDQRDFQTDPRVSKPAAAKTPARSAAPSTSAPLPPGSFTFDLASFAPAVQAASGALPRMATPAGNPGFAPSPVYSSTPGGYTAQGYTAQGFKPTLVDPKALAELYGRPIASQQAVGAPVDERLRSQALARKAALEQQLQALDAGYSQASEQIHGGYQAVSTLLNQAQQNFTQGMAPVTAGQAQANAGVAQSGVLQADAVARILASQGISGVGADQANSAAAGVQAGANAVGTTASDALSGGQSTLGTFFSGLPALAAMGEAGGIGRAELMRTLARGKAVSSSAEAGLASDTAMQNEDLAYRRSLAADDVRSTRERDNALIAQLASVITGNASTLTGAAQFGASATNQASAQTVGDQNQAAASLAAARNQASASTASARTQAAGQVTSLNAQWAAQAEQYRMSNANSARSDAISLAKWNLDNQAGVEAAAAKATRAGVKLPQDFYKSQAKVQQTVGSFISRGAARSMNQALDDKDPKSTLIKASPNANGGVDQNIDASRFTQWQGVTGGTEDDVLVFLNYQIQKGKLEPAQAYAVIRDLSNVIARSQAELEQADQKLTSAQRADGVKTLVKDTESRLKATFDVLSGRNEKKAQYMDPDTGAVITLGGMTPDMIDQYVTQPGVDQLTPEKVSADAAAAASVAKARKNARPATGGGRTADDTPGLISSVRQPNGRTADDPRSAYPAKKAKAQTKKKP